MSDDQGHPDPQPATPGEAPVKAAPDHAVAVGNWVYRGVQFGDITGLAGVTGIELGLSGHLPAGMLLPAGTRPAFQDHVRSLEVSDAQRQTRPSEPISLVAADTASKSNRGEGPALTRRAMPGNGRIRVVHEDVLLRGPSVRPVVKEPLLVRVVQKAVSGELETPEGLVEFLDLADITADETKQVIGPLASVAGGAIAVMYDPSAWRSLRLAFGL